LLPPLSEEKGRGKKEKNAEFSTEEKRDTEKPL